MNANIALLRRSVMEAGFEVTAIESGTESRAIQKRYFMSRDGLAFVTGRSQSAIDKWIGRGWISPARKYGTYSLFALEDVDSFLDMRMRNKGKRTDRTG